MGERRKKGGENGGNRLTVVALTCCCTFSADCHLDSACLASFPCPLARPDEEGLPTLNIFGSQRARTASRMCEGKDLLVAQRTQSGAPHFPKRARYAHGS